MKVRIGRFLSGAENSIGVNADLDIDRLVLTRMIIQAESGHGKSWLLRKIAEATHGHIQQFIIDPEGEFASLREKHDLVIAAAEGGDALAHPRTAGLLATRLLETRASAVLDIYDVKDKHSFVKNFLESMMAAHKKLWHPVLVILDEAHLFCPEKGFGESIASDAVIDIASRGRKRGYALVAATQRISKINKNALADLKNKMIGAATLDLDVKRAAFELGRTPKEALEILRDLNPGEFMVYGPAFGVKAPCLFKSNEVETTHPKVGGKRKILAPPKPTAAIRALLPQLADLPREVEQKAKTEAELRKDLIAARQEITRLERKQVDPKLYDAAVEKGKEIGRNTAPRQKKPNYKEAHREAKTFLKTIETVMDEAVKELDAQISTASHEWRSTIHHRIYTTCENALETIKSRMQEDDGVALQSIPHPQPARRTPMPRATISPKSLEKIEIHLPEREGDGQLLGPEKRILTAIAWMNAATGKETVSQTAAAFLAGYQPGSSGFRNPRSSLAAKKLIEYVGSDLKLTNAGSLLATHPQATPTAEEIQTRVFAKLDGPPNKLLRELVNIYPQGMTQAEHAEKCNYQPGSSGYRNPRSKLSALGLLRYEGDQVFAEGWLFL